MPTLIDAMKPVIDVLEYAEIRVCVAMADIDPPCVFFPVPDLSFRFKERTFEASYRLVLITPNTSRDVAIEVLSDLVTAVQTAIGHRAQTARPVEVVLADNSAAVLAYELAFSMNITKSMEATP